MRRPPGGVAAVAEPATANEPLTPCVGRCRLDPTTGLCQGCGRTLDEIARWASLDAATRRCIMAGLPDRAAAATAASEPGGHDR